MSFTIRRAEEKDVPAILALICAIAEYEHMSGEVVATEETLRASMFTRGRAEALLGEVDGEPVGFVLYFYNFSTFIGREGLYLEDFFVYPAHRGKGYGKKLFARLAQIAIENGCERYEWTCLDWNQPSLDFYRAVGAIPMNEWTVQRLSGDALRHVAAAK